MKGNAPVLIFFALDWATAPVRAPAYAPAIPPTMLVLDASPLWNKLTFCTSTVAAWQQDLWRDGGVCIVRHHYLRTVLVLFVAPEDDHHHLCILSVLIRARF